MERLKDATWRTSSFSGTTGNCVEVGVTPAGRVAGIRDSKSRERGALAVTESVWRQFLDDEHEESLEEVFFRLIDTPVPAKALDGASGGAR